MWAFAFIFCAGFAVAMVLLGGYMVYHLSAEQERRNNLLKLWRWIVKGCLLPLALWSLMNWGVTWWLQPFMPSVQAAQISGRGWFGEFLAVLAGGMFVVSTYWLGVTLGWELYKAHGRVEGEPRANFRALCLTSFVGMLIPAGLLVLIGGWSVVGLALAIICLPAAGYGPSVLNRAKKKPMYSAAIARMKFGKYADAEWEIIRQLENAESDYDGWLMLAELYATKFNDLGEAEQIVLEICDHPKTTPSQLAVALHKLADWHLQIGNDPESARRALQVISLRLPGSHLARMAGLRSAQLPQDADDLRAQRTPPPVPLPALGDNLESVGGLQDTEEATANVKHLTERLHRNPNDTAVRERLARLLADPLGQVDVALEQLDLLLGMEGQPPGKRADWLGLMAAWQLKFKENKAAAIEILQRIVDEFPTTPQAHAAQRRLAMLATERKVPESRAAAPPPKIKILPD